MYIFKFPILFRLLPVCCEYFRRMDQFYPKATGNNFEPQLNPITSSCVGIGCIPPGNPGNIGVHSLQNRRMEDATRDFALKVFRSTDEVSWRKAMAKNRRKQEVSRTEASTRRGMDEEPATTLPHLSTTCTGREPRFQGLVLRVRGQGLRV